MTADLSFVTYCRARYLTPDKNGETRADRNARFGQDEVTPEWSVPDGGQYLFDWFEEISSGHNRVSNDRIYRITWVEFAAWQQVSGNVVYPHEFAILRAMDNAYCEALEGELQYQKVRAQEEAAKAQAMKNKG